MWRKNISLLLIIALCLGFSVSAGATGFDDWARNAQVGPYQPEEEDWDAIYEAAKKEGKVVIYASTSRISDAGQSFELAYPGITVEAYNVSSVEAVEKLQREFDAGIRTADLIMTAALNQLADDLLERHVVVNYVPRELIPVIPVEFREPLLSHRFGSVVMAYSNVAFDKAPITNIWELILPEWNNRFVMRDPLRADTALGWLISLVRNADELEASYEEFFGEPLTLTTPNAGYELIKKLLDNGLQLQSASRGVLDIVDQHNVEKPVIGSMGSSSYRDVLAGDYSFEIIWELQPTSGYAYRNALAMVGFNEHPNAAKLFLNWLMGSGDGTGFAPWNVPGNFPVRTDMATPEPFLPIAEYNYWYDDQEHHDLTYDVMDFWMMHM